MKHKLTALIAMLAIASVSFGQSVEEKVNASIDKGLAFLKSQQKPDGGWQGEKDPPAITAIVLKAFAQDPKTGPKADFVKKGYDKLLTYQLENGGIYQDLLANYNTAIRLNRVDLAHVEGELAGLIETIDRSDHLLIENVAVAPQRHGQGLGRALMSHAETVARVAGYREVRLYTNRRFEANVQLYLRLGYSIDREEESALGVTVYMSKSLPAVVV